MTPELTVLTLAALLQVFQFCAYSATSVAQVGPKKAAGPRDNPIVLTGTASRLQRAMNNHFEALILFTIAVLVTQASEQNTAYSAACAWFYLGARVLYVPAYVFGLTPWRSVIWLVGLLATVAMLTAAIL
ncbi:MAPEG family protein [Sulfitobacter sp.]|nr:MAPEG family protein [Sulfitobacter sp.]